MPNETVNLIAPPGTDEANFAGNRYRVGNNGTINVPVEASVGLLATGGFIVSPEKTVVELCGGYSAFHNLDDPTASFSFGGVSYTPDDKGVILAPNEAVSSVVAHGFSLVGN